MRNTAIDVCKGIGLILVILGHVSGIPPSIHCLIYAFHMPLFFLLSGLTFRSPTTSKSLAEYLKSRLFRLIIPAWVMGIICGIPFLIFLILGRRGISPDIFYQKLAGTLLGYSKIEYNFLTSPLWFLFCLFLVEAIASCLPTLGRMRKAALLIATGALGVIFFRPVIDLPFGLAGVPAALLFFGLGIAVSQKVDSLMKREILKSIFPTAAIFTLAFIYSPNEVSISEGKLGEGFLIFLYIAAALSGSYLIYCASYHISVAWKISKKLTSFLGTHGLPIIGFNYWINSLISQISGGIATKYWIISFFVQLFLLYGITYITAKTDGLVCQLIEGRWRPKIRSAK